MLKVEEANAILSLPKETVKEMEWLLKPNKSHGRWFQYDTSCKIDNEIREDIYLRATWRGEYPEMIQGNVQIWKSEYITCGIFASTNRILAIDCYDTFHRNKPDMDLPYAGKRIQGLHIHKWTKYQDKYAEPLELTDRSLQGIIIELATLSNTVIKGGFVAPPMEQLSLF